MKEEKNLEEDIVEDLVNSTSSAAKSASYQSNTCLKSLFDNMNFASSSLSASENLQLVTIGLVSSSSETINNGVDHHRKETELDPRMSRTFECRVEIVGGSENKEKASNDVSSATSSSDVSWFFVFAQIYQEI